MIPTNEHSWIMIPPFLSIQPVLLASGCVENGDEMLG